MDHESDAKVKIKPVSIFLGGAWPVWGYEQLRVAGPMRSKLHAVKRTALHSNVLLLRFAENSMPCPYSQRQIEEK